jgi:nucleoside-diphosphate-sugar epimerase
LGAHASLDEKTTVIESEYSGVRVAVVGAAGFIGRWVARALSRQGAQLVSLVRDREAMNAIAGRYGIRAEVAEVDLADTVAVSALIERVRPSITFNLAAYGVDPLEREEGVMRQINVVLVTALARAVSSFRDPAWRGQALVHAGSALEYGSTRGELSEDAAPNPLDQYGKSKLAATKALAESAAETGLRAMIARLFTVYGPGEKRDRLLPSLIEASRSGGPVHLTAGDQQRDFCYVEEVAEGLLRLGLSDAAPGETVNLATGHLTSVREFILCAARILPIPQQDLEFGAKPVRDNEMWHGPVRVDRLRKLLNWVPVVDIEEGIRRTVAFDVEGRDTDPWRESGVTRSKERSDAA